MGQQQLLLIILVTVIIGIAAVVAVSIMQNANKLSIKSAIRQDIVMVMNDAKIYYEKPNILGGGGNSFAGMSKDHIMSINPQNENGSYEVSGSKESVTVDGTSQNGEIVLSATATMSADGMEISWSETELSE